MQGNGVCVCVCVFVRDCMGGECLVAKTTASMLGK